MKKTKLRSRILDVLAESERPLFSSLEELVCAVGGPPTKVWSNIWALVIAGLVEVAPPNHLRTPEPTDLFGLTQRGSVRQRSQRAPSLTELRRGV